MGRKTKLNEITLFWKMFCHLIYLFFNFLPLSMLFWAFVMEMGLNSLSATEA